MEHRGVEGNSSVLPSLHESGGTNMGKTFLGIALCLAAISIGAVGVVLQRKGKLLDGTQHRAVTVFCGTLVMLLSAVPDVWAWALVPQVLVASIYTCRMIPVCLLGHYFLEEHLLRSDWISLFVTMAGSVLSVACGPHVKDGKANPDTAIHSSKLNVYIILGSCILVLGFVVAHVLLCRGTRTGSGWALRCAWIFLAAYVFVFEKVFNTLAGKDYDATKTLLEQSSPYFYEVIALAIFGLLDLYAQIVALRVVPVHIFETGRTATVQLLVLLQGGMIFDELAGLDSWRLLFTFLGVFIALYGALAIQRNEESRAMTVGAAKKHQTQESETTDTMWTELT